MKTQRKNQKALQTGNPRGHYTKGDAHPTVNGLVYACWNPCGERWQAPLQQHRHSAVCAMWYMNKQIEAKLDRVFHEESARQYESNLEQSYFYGRDNYEG